MGTGRNLTAEKIGISTVSYDPLSTEESHLSTPGSGPYHEGWANDEEIKCGLGDQIKC